MAYELQPMRGVPDVVCNPWGQVGEPTIEDVPVDTLAEMFRTGGPVEAIAEVHDLTARQVQAAMGYTLKRQEGSLHEAS